MLCTNKRLFIDNVLRAQFKYVIKFEIFVVKCCVGPFIYFFILR